MADPRTITAITADPREPDLRRIKMDRRIIARIRRRDVDRMGLAVGTPLDEPMLASLDRCEQRATLRVRAIRSLSRAAASRQRLATRLSAHATSHEQLEDVLNELVADGLLDDHMTATRMTEETLRAGPVGARALSVKLQRRGFETSLVERIVAEQLGERDEYADAMDAARTAMRSLRNLPPDTATRRLAARLARKGFSEETIAEVIGTRLRRGEVGSREPEVQNDHDTP
jgi:SOS response regulatory protein OraA/RecX